MDTILNKTDWNFINNYSSSDFSQNFENLIIKYLKIANQPETNKILPNRKDISYFNSIVGNNTWIYNIKIDSNISKEKIKQERYKSFLTLLNSIRDA